MRFTPISGLGVAAMAAAMMQHHAGMDGVTITPVGPSNQEPERCVSIIAPEPAPEPRRHAGKREAARRLRQLAKRNA